LSQAKVNEGILELCSCFEKESCLLYYKVKILVKKISTLLPEASFCFFYRVPGFAAFYRKFISLVRQISQKRTSILARYMFPWNPMTFVP